MSDANKSKPTTWDRKVVLYLPPYYHRLYVGYLKHQELTMSEAGRDLLKKHFDSLSEHERQKYLNLSKEGVSKNSY